MNPGAAREALKVLGRTVGWLARQDFRNAGQARYVEATLRPWVEKAGSGEDEVAAAFRAFGETLAGFDGAAEEERRVRAARMAASLDSLRALVGEGDSPVMSEARAVLVLDGAPAILPERVPVAVPEPITPAAVVADVVQQRPEDESPRRGRRRRGRREDAPPQAAEPAPEVTAAAEPPPPPKVVAPEPPPRPTFPLGHPDDSGATLDSLGVLEAAEVELLVAAGIHNVAELMLTAPTSIERAGERWIPGVSPEGPVIVRGRVAHRFTRVRPGVRRFELRLTHERGDMLCRWVGAGPIEARHATAGSDLGVAGTFESNADTNILVDGEPLGVDGRGGDWVPVYGIAGIADTRVRAAVRAALRRYTESIADHFAPEMIDRLKLMPLAFALRDAHFPSNTSRRGKARLAFDELLQVQLGIALSQAHSGRERGTALHVCHGLVAQALGMEGWHLSDAQETAFDEVRRDLRSGHPMARLLQGEVGAGKRHVAHAAMIAVAESKLQAVWVAPDALTAENRFLFAEGTFRAAGIEPLLFTTTPTRTQLEDLKKGEIRVIFGTPAFLREPPALRKLGLVVVEADGAHGLPDLAPLEAQIQRPYVLVLTPAPVATAVALHVYGRLAMTVVASAATAGVETLVCTAERRPEAYAAGRQAIEDGRQVVIAFPVMGDRDLLSPSEARRLAEVLARDEFPGARIGIFNGAMSREERFRAYEDFLHRRSDVLLATTYLEHGPGVPNAAVMIVEHAEQFDLVRLHRLRAHVVGGWHPGRCFYVLGADPDPAAKFAIELLEKETDGFRIAELDLKHRGAAKVLGPQAAGKPLFAWADPVTDRESLLRARQEAFRLISQDAGFRRRSNRALVWLLRNRFGEDVLPDGPGAPVGGAPVAAPSGDAQANARRKRRRRK